MQDKRYDNNVILDLGCGKAELYQILSDGGHILGRGNYNEKESNRLVIKEMFNYDLVSCADYV